MLITPGAMQFTVIPLGASSFARAFVRPIIPALDAEYTTSQEAPTSPQIDDIFIILPQCSETIYRVASREHFIAPRRFVDITASSCSSLMSWIRLFCRAIPALFIRA